MIGIVVDMVDTKEFKGFMATLSNAHDSLNLAQIGAWSDGFSNPLIS